MLAYSRGSNCLAGAAPLEHRVPAVVGSFCTNLDIAQWVEQQPDKLSVRVRLPLSARCVNSSQPRVIQAGFLPSTLDKVSIFPACCGSGLAALRLSETANLNFAP